MRIGGGIEKPYSNPQEWLALVKDLGYTCVLSPVDYRASGETIDDYLEVIRANDLIIGEVGAWVNTLDLDDGKRKQNIDYCINQLALADRLGANCCVNVAGARTEVWDGFCSDNYTDDYYGLVIDTTRAIIDAVKPRRTFFTLEPMPWMTPTSPDEYLQLLKDVDRPGFAVHLDFVNMLNTPERFVKRNEFVRDCFKKLAPYIKSVHIKDVKMSLDLPCNISECMPGTGEMDFSVVVGCCEQLGKDTTAFVEHLPDYDSYKQAAACVRSFIR